VTNLRIKANPNVNRQSSRFGKLGILGIEPKEQANQQHCKGQTGKAFGKMGSEMMPAGIEGLQETKGEFAFYDLALKLPDYPDHCELPDKKHGQEIANKIIGREAKLPVLGCLDPSPHQNQR
jgi:hypothetical protein